MEVDQVPSQATFKTTISKQPYYYFAIALVSTQTQPIDAEQYHGYLMMVISQWLGAIGGKFPVDILNYDFPQAIIRVPFDKHKAVWQAMTVNTFRLLSSDATGYFQVVRNSAFSMGVIDSSRK